MALETIEAVSNYLEETLSNQGASVTCPEDSNNSAFLNSHPCCHGAFGDASEYTPYYELYEFIDSPSWSWGPSFLWSIVLFISGE